MSKKMKPKSINILGLNYKIEYVDNPAEVDIHKREALWGQIDYWTRTIRVYDNGRPVEDVFETILHEALHGIATQLHLKCFDKDDEDKGHDELDILALSLTDLFVRNNWLNLED